VRNVLGVVAIYGQVNKTRRNNPWWLLASFGWKSLTFPSCAARARSHGAFRPPDTIVAKRDSACSARHGPWLASEAVQARLVAEVEAEEPQAQEQDRDRDRDRDHRADPHDG
jgi:hypothetical protein